MRLIPDLQLAVVEHLSLTATISLKWTCRYFYKLISSQCLKRPIIEPVDHGPESSDSGSDASGEGFYHGELNEVPHSEKLDVRQAERWGIFKRADMLGCEICCLLRPRTRFDDSQRFSIEATTGIGQKRRHCMKNGVQRIWTEMETIELDGVAYVACFKNCRRLHRCLGFYRNIRGKVTDDGDGNIDFDDL